MTANDGGVPLAMESKMSSQLPARQGAADARRRWRIPRGAFVREGHLQRIGWADANAFVAPNLAQLLGLLRQLDVLLREASMLVNPDDCSRSGASTRKRNRYRRESDVACSTF